MPTYSLAKQGELEVVGGLKVKDFKQLDTYVIPIDNVTRLIDYKSKKGRHLTAFEKAALDKVVIHPNLIVVLFAIDEHYTDYKLEITPHGGYRDSVTFEGQVYDLNKAVSGATYSQHRKGTAADIRMRHKTTGKVLDTAEFAVMAEFIMNKLGIAGGVGIYDEDCNYIHIDVRGGWSAWFETYIGNGLATQGGRRITFHYVQGNVQEAAGIRLIQRALISLGYECEPADGKFGPLTYDAVCEFQKKKKLTVDGKPGIMTLRALNEDVGRAVLPWAA